MSGEVLPECLPPLPAGWPDRYRAMVAELDMDTTEFAEAVALVRPPLKCPSPLSVDSTLVRELDTRTGFGPKNRPGVEFADDQVHAVEFADRGRSWTGG